jgi:hypothetical protein
LAPSAKKQAMNLLKFKTALTTPEKATLLGPFLAKLPKKAAEFHAELLRVQGISGKAF